VHVTLIEDEKICNATLQRKKPDSSLQKSTVDITHELWLDKNSIQDIATIRKLTLKPSKPSGQVDSVKKKCSGHIAARQNQGIRGSL
jgi:hypothetical protein